MRNIEMMLSTVQEHFNMPTITPIILNSTPKLEAETLRNYLERADTNYPSMSGMVNKTLVEYFVTVFYCDSTDNDNIKVINFGKLEGHMIPIKLENADFFNSTNMWFVMLSLSEKIVSSFPIYNAYLYCS